MSVQGRQRLPQSLPLVVCLLFVALSATMERTGAQERNRVIAEIPIEVERNKTIVPVTVGGAALRMILDSGMAYDGVLVFDSAKLDLRQFANLATAQIGGAGSGAPAGALTDLKPNRFFEEPFR